MAITPQQEAFVSDEWTKLIALVHEGLGSGRVERFEEIARERALTGLGLPLSRVQIIRFFFMETGMVDDMGDLFGLIPSICWIFLAGRYLQKHLGSVYAETKDEINFNELCKIWMEAR
jgi:hypothetical protein